jgi:CubicO group peptidase (beta-lactamase class C family)
MPPGFGELAGANKVIFSASLFSLNDPAATEMQYHYTAPQVANAQHGTNEVDGDSIYRVASVSKLVTTFAGMIELTDAQWNTPLSEIFPGLVSSSNDTESPIFRVQWDLTTPAALASHLSGISTLSLPQGDLLVTYEILAATTNTSMTAFPRSLSQFLDHAWI